MVMVDGVKDDGCQASCVDWYGNARPIFLPERMLALMGYELVEQLGWEYPDAVFYPTGGGVGLIGMWKAFQELEQLGWVKKGRRPRMIAVQAAGCAPVVRAFEEGARQVSVRHAGRRKLDAFRGRIAERDGETDPLRRKDDRGVNTDHFTAGIDERSAGVTRV